MGFRTQALEGKAAREDDKVAREERDAAPDQQWEYLARNLGKVAGLALEGDFNKIGRRGFEFVAVADGYAIFKRRSDGASADPVDPAAM